MSAELPVDTPDFEVEESAHLAVAEPVYLGPEFEQFANFLDDCISPRLTSNQQKQRLLELPQKYYDNAKRRLDLLRRPFRNDSRDDVDMDTDEPEAPFLSPAEAQEIKGVEHEVQTWDLFRRVLPLRHSDVKLRPSRTSESTQADALQQFLETDRIAQERLAVIHWLQANASSGPDIDELVRELQQNAGRDEIIAHGWLHTRSAIKQRKSVTGWPHLLDRQTPQISQTFLNKDGAPLVTQLDPDAVSRQGRKLEPQDEYFERAIWLGCFEHLRRGSSLEVIKNWCEDRTELWRAVAVSPLPLSLDYKKLPTEESPEAVCLWRRMCLASARNAGSDSYERAVYGLLSGEIPTVERVSQTWDDFLFASYNGLLRTRVDSFLLDRINSDVRSTLSRSFPTFDATQYIGNHDDVEKHIISSLETRPETRLEASQPNKALQGAFLADELDQHLAGQGALVRADQPVGPSSALVRAGHDENSGDDTAKYFKLDQHDGLRIVAHVYLLHNVLERQSASVLTRSIRDTGRMSSQMLILAEYTKLLYRAGLKVLIPLYCSVLPEPACYEIMSESLVKETESEQRVELLNLMNKTGLRGASFARIQSEQMYRELGVEDQPPKIATEKFSILQDQEQVSIRLGRMIKPDFIASDEDTVAEKNERAIRGLEWLKDINLTWPEIFDLGTKIYKFFYRNMYLLAARELKERVSFSSVMEILIDDSGSDATFFDDPSFWSQLLEQSNLQDLSAEKVMKDARNYRELEALVAALDNLETVASLANMSEDMPPTNRDFWGKVGVETRNIRPLMQPLLQSWLDAGIEDGDSQLKQIREAYLPETILAYISALQFAGTGVSRDHLLEAMELASVLAAKGNEGLVGIFKEAGRMKELVNAFAGCSKVLAFATAEKRITGTGAKKLKELGWSRDLWSVKS